MKTQNIKKLKKNEPQSSQESFAQLETFPINEINRDARNGAVAENDSLTANSVNSPASHKNYTGGIGSNAIGSDVTKNIAGNSHTIPNSEDSILQAQIGNQSNDYSRKDKHQKSSVERFIESVPQFYSLQAQRLYDCTAGECHDLAVDAIKNVKRNESAGWVLIALAAYCVWHKTPPLAGGSGNTDAPDEGRMNALEKLAADCLSKNAKISVSTLYDYVRRIQVLVEDPLIDFAEEGEEFIAQKRTELINDLFLVPSSFARAAAYTTKPIEAMEIAFQKLETACQNKDDRRLKFTTAQYKEAIRHLKAEATGASSDDKEVSLTAAEPINRKDLTDENESFQTSNDLDLFNSNDNAVDSLEVEQLVSSQIKCAAQRANISFEQVVEIHLSLLRFQLSIFEDIGAKKR